MLQQSSNIPFWRNIRFLKVFFQVLFLQALVVLAVFLISNMLNGLERQGMKLGLSFLNSEAGFGIAEGIEFDPSDSYLMAFWVGVVNTLKVSIIGIFCATVMGFFFGIARLSSNWLVRQIASVYVEFFRNIPVLLQILFWYAITRVLPVVRESFSFFNDRIFLNNRGLYLSSVERAEGFNTWMWYLLSGLILAILVVLGLAAYRYFFKFREIEQTDKPTFRSNLIFSAKWTAAPIFLITALVGWFLIPETPFRLERPVFQGFNFVGGISFSPEFSALLIGLAVYTSAFIAEIVRSGIQAVVKGQREAARSVGLKESQVLRLVVIPQAIPIIVPPLTSQFLNLAKNSSIAIFIGYPDLFQIGETMMEQTGQAITIFAMMMVSYLTMSLTASAFMNWYNRRIMRRGQSKQIVISQPDELALP